MEEHWIFRENPGYKRDKLCDLNSVERFNWTCIRWTCIRWILNGARILGLLISLYNVHPFCCKFEGKLYVYPHGLKQWWAAAGCNNRFTQHRKCESAQLQKHSDIGCYSTRAGGRAYPHPLATTTGSPNRSKLVAAYLLFEDKESNLI